MISDWFSPVLRDITMKAVALLAAVMFLQSCEDDFPVESSIPEGVTAISLEMEFSPMAEGLTGGRAATGKGDALNGISDLCILFYDKDGNLLDDYVYYYNPATGAQKPEGLPEGNFITTPGLFKEVTRTDDDASNGKVAQEKSMSGTFRRLIVPFGEYTVIGVANLGNIVSDKYKTATTTYDVLFNDDAVDVSTVDGVRGLRLEWDSSCLANNAEMFGCFTVGQGSMEAAQFFSAESLPTVVINSNGMALKSWLRRAASKVTIAFDGTGLRDNIWIHLKSAAIMDIPAGCDLGRSCKVTDTDSLLCGKPTDGEAYDSDTQVIDYTNGHAAVDGGKYNTEWTTIVHGRRYPEEESESHKSDEISLFFYENMQGLGRDKRQYPEIGDDGTPTGDVKDNDIIKDSKPCGTYIEVKAYYRSRDNIVSNGDIIYRFMLGKDTETDYNAERNYHYKLTLCFNGKANDYDWHIDYNEEPGIKVPIPYYYVPYMYNQHMVYPVTIVGELEGDLEAEITRSDWFPCTDEKPGEIPAGVEVYSREKVKNNGPWHGFLSLRQAPADDVERGFKAAVGGDKYIYNHTASNGQFNGLPYNQAYWEGKGNPDINEEVNHRGHRFYNIAKTPTTGRSDNANDNFALDGTYEVSTTVKNGVPYTTFMIPLYSREINLIKTAGYRGNNPYIGYYRYAEITFKAKIKGVGVQTIVAKVLQVPRIVNPKGIYRSWDCTDPFNVHLMHNTTEDSSKPYEPVKSSGGPWSAEVEYITGGGGWLSIGGKVARGVKIYGDTDSEIQFDVKFLSKAASSKDVRCAVIKVLYNNYTCTHRIMVRQGYAPVAMTGSSTVKWHTANLEYVTTGDDGGYVAHEERYPRSEGSMFRYGNLLDAIASYNNKMADRFLDYPVGRTDFIMAPYAENKDKPGKKWREIKTNKIRDFFNTAKLYIGDTECRVASQADFQNLRKECDFGAGILYGDGATETLTDVEATEGYASYVDENKRQSYGIRGWFVYNVGKDGLNLFFPIGVSGHGRRKDGTQRYEGADLKTPNYTLENGKKEGVLRYSSRADVMPDGSGHYAEYRPLLYTIYKQNGAVYWTGEEGISGGTLKCAWDINYSTFDFNTFNNDAYELFNDTDAAFIRLVED